MKPEMILQSDILDILFEGRNKDYGAYALRKTYGKHLMYAIGGMGLAVAILAAISFFYKSPDPQKLITGLFVSDTVEFVVIDPPDDPVPPKVRSAKPAVVFATPIITRNEVADSIPEAVKLLDDDVQIGLIATIDSGLDIGIQRPVEVPVESPAVVSEPAKAPEIYKQVEQMPEFPGGSAALYRFLSRNLRVPDEALEPGDKVRVVVKFVVSAGGEITGIRFAESVEKAFEEEVQRVMKKMPKWKPGIQNGRAVAVYYNIPVVFEAPDE